MSTWYYIKEQTLKEINSELLPVKTNVVFHVDISTGNNSAGQSWRDCVLERTDPDGNGVVSSIRDLVNRFAAQNTKLQSGAAYEIQEIMGFSSAYLTPIQRNTEVQARAQEIESTLLNELQVEMEFTGYNNTVV